MVSTLPIFRKSPGLSAFSSGKKQPTASNASITSLAREVRLKREPMSPIKRTDEWLKSTETPAKKDEPSSVFSVKDSKKDSKIARSSDNLGVKGSKVTKSAVSQASVSGKGRSSKSHRKVWLSRLWSFIFSKEKNDEKSGDNPDLEGATVVGETTPAKSSLPDRTLVKENSPASFLALEGNTTLIDDDNSTLSEEEASDRKEEQINSEDLYRGWTEDEVWLFEKLDWRGYEPILPKNWAGDFLTMYDLLFTNDDSIAFIKSASGKDYHGKPCLLSLNSAIIYLLTIDLAIKALRGLIKLSGHVRDRVWAGFSPEETLQREIESYFRWSMRDAGLSKTEHIPAIAIATAVPNESVASVVGRITDQLHEMGNRYRSLWLDRARSTVTDDVQYYVHDLPTLYGVVIKYSVVSLVTYDVVKLGQAVRCLGTYNFLKQGQDVWHALAVSIIFIRARNYLMELKEEGEFGDEANVESTDEDA